jgi:hypothetical protein
LEPVWEQFAALVPERPVVAPSHPLGCHRPRVPDRLVFEHVVAALVHGSGYERIASPGCSDRTIRRRVKEWAGLGLMERLHTLALEQYDRLIGLELGHVCADGCITKAPGGGAVAGRSPVDRGKQGLKRATVTDGAGIPLHLVAAPANRHDSRLLRPTLEGLAKLAPLPAGLTAHLDRAFDNAPLPRPARGAGLRGQHRPQGGAGASSGGHALGSRADAGLDERLRQAAPLHRARRRGRRLLPVPGRRLRHRPHAHPTRPLPLPLARPAHHAPPEVMPIAGRS